jgi:hypothetical protein
MTKSKRKARAAKKDVKRTEKVILKLHEVLRNQADRITRLIEPLAIYNQSDEFGNAGHVRKIIYISGLDNQFWGTADMYKLYSEQDAHL